MFETYLPILQYSANLFSNIPVIKLPKVDKNSNYIEYFLKQCRLGINILYLQSASNIFLEAIQILQYCQETNGIMGGALFYNNKYKQA